MKCLICSMNYIVIIVILKIGSVMVMDPVTLDLVTPLKEYGERCGYESCPRAKEGMLTVHLVPHTHAELGYSRTFDQHYTGDDGAYERTLVNMKRILDFTITQLWADPNKKFALGDMPYFFHWWANRDGTVRRMVYQLLRQGRLQLVGGGWGMPDEATTSYHAIIDQYTYSLRKLNATFLDCGRPLVAWQSDVFGHSREFTSLVAQMGFDGLFINPISFDDEIPRMQRQALEFVWRGSDDLGAATDMYTHKLFDGYWAPPGFCFSSTCEDPLLVTSDSLFKNVDERAARFIESMVSRQAPNYNSSHVLVMMGQMMGYFDAPMWFNNMDKLIAAVNDRGYKSARKVHVSYSSPACYLKAVHDENPPLEIKQDDFFPFGYDKHSYVAGTYTARPSLKLLAREGHVYLQMAKQLQVLAKLWNNDKAFEEFQWIMGVIQDHNVITGALRQDVKDYYVKKMDIAIQKSTLILKQAFNKLRDSPAGTIYYRCDFNISKCRNSDQYEYFIVIYNPLSWNVSMPIRLPISNRQYFVYDPKGEMVNVTIMRMPYPILALPNKNSPSDHELVFIAEDIPALGYRSYYIQHHSFIQLNKRETHKKSLKKKLKRKKKKYLIRQTDAKLKDDGLIDIDSDVEYFEDNSTEDAKVKTPSDIEYEKNADRFEYLDFKVTTDTVTGIVINEEIYDTNLDDNKPDSMINIIENRNDTRTYVKPKQKTELETNLKHSQVKTNKKDTEGLNQKGKELEAVNTEPKVKVKETGEELEPKRKKIKKLKDVAFKIESGDLEPKITDTDGKQFRDTKDESRDITEDLEPINKTLHVDRKELDTKNNDITEELQPNRRLLPENTNIPEIEDEITTNASKMDASFNPDEELTTIEPEGENIEVEYATEASNARPFILESTRRLYEYFESNDLYIQNKYIRLSLDPSSKKISSVTLSNRVHTALDIQFYYYASDDPVAMGTDQVVKRSPGAYIFRSIDNKPVPILDYLDVQVFKNRIVEEVHYIYADYASLVVRLYVDSPVVEVDWLVGPISVQDGVGKDVFIRYRTDLEHKGVFYTDSNGRQTVKRIRNARPLFEHVNKDPVAGNYYPVTSKIYIEDLEKNIRFSVFNDRSQGGTSLYDGEIDLMLHRRILTDDCGAQALLNETHNGEGIRIRGKHYLYLSKANFKPNKIFEKKFAKEIELKPQILISESRPYGEDSKGIWLEQNNEYGFLKNKLPIGVHVLTVEQWNDGAVLLRLENYLEKADLVRNGIKKVFLNDIFRSINIRMVRETTLAGNIWLKDYLPLQWKKRQRFVKNFNDFYGSDSEKTLYADDDDLKVAKDIDLNEGITLKPQQIRTFVCWFDYINM